MVFLLFEKGRGDFVSVHVHQYIFTLTPRKPYIDY